jgi:hypothetical protein
VLELQFADVRDGQVQEVTPIRSLAVLLGELPTAHEGLLACLLVHAEAPVLGRITV